jgi:dUTP pyrophosphatase
MLEIKIKKLNRDALMPQKMSDGAAGYDLYAANIEPIEIKPQEVKLIPTGIAVSIPANYEAQVRPRSGLAINHLIGVLNSPGTIDSDYRGEIKVILFNFNNEAFIVTKGMRIAQLVFSRHETVDFRVYEQLDETERGITGFGNTKI